MILKLSDNLRLIKISSERYVGWNRYWPEFLILNQGALNLLKKITDQKTAFSNLSIVEKNHYEKLKKYNFIPEKDSDRYRKKFYDSITKAIAVIDAYADNFFNNDKSMYNQLYITNDRCNLFCNYCIKKYKIRNQPVNIYHDEDERKKIINMIIDQYIERKINNKINPISISFNGGEIFLDWSIVKDIIVRITNKYNKSDFAFYFNTNMTLMTKEIAEFLNKFNVKIYISIDGYKEAHDRTRRFKSGKGSFNSVIRCLDIYRKYNQRDEIKGFQGTIEYANKFIAEKVFSMKKYGFNGCRLAPNLLNTTKSDAKRKAVIMGNLIELSKRYDFKLTETVLGNIEKVINLEKYNFFFNCVGLSCYPNFGINLNISKMTLSLLCSYVYDSSMSVDEVGFDIFNPALWQKARGFILKRIEALRKYCDSCDIIGICRGGCILSGLDLENEKNEAACAYQKKILEIFIKKSFDNKLV